MTTDHIATARTWVFEEHKYRLKTIEGQNGHRPGRAVYRLCTSQCRDPTRYSPTFKPEIVHQASMMRQYKKLVTMDFKSLNSI